MSSNPGGASRGAGAGAGASSVAEAAIEQASTRFLSKLKSGGPKKGEDIQRRAAHGLREFVAAQRQELPARDFSSFFISLSHRIFDLVNSNDNYEKQVRVIATVASAGRYCECDGMCGASLHVVTRCRAVSWPWTTSLTSP